MAAVVAITRELGAGLERCELTHLQREPIDLEQAAQQHRAYQDTLEQLGCKVVELSAEPGLPDGVFVEDAAVVLDELAVLARPGAASRRAETENIAAALGPYRPLARIRAPATLDGGDVLVAGRSVYVGLSTRSNMEAVGQLRQELGPRGYTVQPVPVQGCLHLKSAACLVADRLLLVQPAWVDPAAFSEVETLDVDPTEPFAANAVRIHDAVVHAAAFPRTRRRLEERGLTVVPVAMDELAKAEGGVSCCSLLVSGRVEQA